MPTYGYRAARSDGVVLAGTVEAVSRDHAGALLGERGLLAVELREAVPGARREPGIAKRDLAIVFRSIASLVAAGVPLERALGATLPLAQERLRRTLEEANRRLREGAGFAEALKDDGAVPIVVIGMLRAGERGGRLAAALEDAAGHLEQEAALIARVRQALAYPMLVAIAGTISLMIIGAVVVPRFATLLGGLGQELPPATRLLLACSDLLVHGWPYLGAWLAGSLWMALHLVRRPAGRVRCHRALLALPLIGPLRHALATARLARATGGMLRTGMPLLVALEAAGEAAGDAAVAERLGRVRDLVAQGQTITAALQQTGALPAGTVQLVAVGEGSGRLPEMMERAGALAAQEADRRLSTLTTLAEPALIVLFGGLVAFVAAALLQAVYSLRPGGA